jgi:hypothetical protein
VRNAGGIVAIAMSLYAFAPSAASAQGFLDALFGGFGGAQRSRSLPPQASSFASPFDFGNSGERRSSGEYAGGGGQAYCVRTCDGRYFPLQRSSSASPAEICKSFCPAAKTMVFHGGKIDTSVSGSTRYADLDNAFVYKEKLVDGCTCNGKDATGLAQVSVVTDPTLRAGDIIATNNGLQTVRNTGNKTADFIPVTPAQLGKQLAGLKVSPQPEPAKIEPIAEETTASTPKKKVRSQSAQNSRPAQRSSGLFGFPF